MCDYYLLCENVPEGTTPHPIIGPVLTCQRCADKHDTPLDKDDWDAYEHPETCDCYECQPDPGPSGWTHADR